MTIISNSFSLACRLLLSKYTISTLQSIDSADNQHDYGCIWKFSRFIRKLERKLCYDFRSKFIQPTLWLRNLCIANANLAIFFGLEARLERLIDYWNTFAVNAMPLHPVIDGSYRLS